MHTMKRQNESEWIVGTLERDRFGDQFVPMFGGLSVDRAVRLTSVLNGGSPHPDNSITMSAATLESLWRYAEEYRLKSQRG
jgi:hypothetical protein